ncbi:DUF362 domain-containing protein [Thermodesulfobacteriota bacterium]
MDHPITRRESVKKLVKLSGGLALSGMSAFQAYHPPAAQAGEKTDKFIAEGIGTRPDYSVKELMKKLFDSVGGMERFVSKGDIVVIKPNISWARTPQMAATTNPDVMKAAIELCREAGAKKVRIADNTIHNANQCFAITGAGMVAKQTGADLVFPRSSLMRDMKIQGRRLNVWPVFTPIIEADKVINLPIAKVHSLSGLTLGMKNWIGGVGGRRNALHQDIHQTIVDLARFFKPTLTLIDATRIMVSNGPSGGRLADAKMTNRLILSNDPVAADGAGARLFGIDPKKIGFIHLASQQELGTYDMGKLDQKQAVL